MAGVLPKIDEDEDYSEDAEDDEPARRNQDESGEAI